MAKLQTERVSLATAAAADIAKVVAREAETSAATEQTGKGVAESARELPMVDLLGFDMSPAADHTKDTPPKVTAREAAGSTLKAVKALTELIAEDQVCQIPLIMQQNDQLKCLNHHPFPQSESEKEISHQLSLIRN